MSTLLEYDEWLDKNYDDVYIEFMESGAYYDSDEERFFERKYSKYEEAFNETNTTNT